MKKVLFALAFVAMMLPTRAQITEFPYREMFDGATASEWVLTTLDECTGGVEISGNSSINYLLFHYPDATCAADQWAISPAITLPANANLFVLQYYVALSSYMGIESHYEVRLSNGSTETTDFTTLLFDEEGGNGLSFDKRSLDLSDYAGQTIRIAFHNITANDGDAMLLTGVYVGQLEAPQVAIDGPAATYVNEEVTFRAASDDANATFNWTIDGVAQNTHDATLTTSFNEVGTYVVAVAAVNAAGSSDPASISISVSECTSLVNDFPWEEGFEAGIGCWTAVDWDGDTYNWLDTYTENDFDASSFVYSGSAAALSHSFQNYDHQGNRILAPLTPDNWLISPAIALPATGVYELSWYAAGANPQYGDENYAVYVGSSNTVESMLNSTALLEETTPYEYERRSVSLANYAGQTIYVAFRHYNCTDMFAMGLDDISIAPLGGIENANEANIAIYPNPVRDMLTVNGENVKNVEIIDVNGRVVLNSNRAGQIDMSELSDGVYMVRVMSENGVSTKKIVKK